MDKKASKKLGVIGSVIFVILLFVAAPALYWVAEVPLEAVAFTIIVAIIIAAVMLYAAAQRFKEIEEGLEDDVDDY